MIFKFCDDRGKHVTNVFTHQSKERIHHLFFIFFSPTKAIRPQNYNSILIFSFLDKKQKILWTEKYITWFRTLKQKKGWCLACKIFNLEIYYIVCWTARPFCWILPSCQSSDIHFFNNEKSRTKIMMNRLLCWKVRPFYWLFSLCWSSDILKA